MNPYGFKYGRRYNENNVDLNRNVIIDGVEKGLTFEWLREEHPTKADYLKFSYAINWERRWKAPWDDVLFFIRAFYLLTSYKYTDLKRAAISGQYFKKNGIWYG